MGSLIFGLYHFKRDRITLYQPQVKERLEFHPSTCGWRVKNVQITKKQVTEDKIHSHIPSQQAVLLSCVR